MPMLPSMPGIPGMAEHTYASLCQKYHDFAFPEAEILLAGTPFKDKQGQMIVTDINVEQTSGFEASIARFRIYNVYDTDDGSFKFEDVKKQVLLGNAMTIKLGYLGSVEPVFVGFVASVSFCFDPEDLPFIEVTGMDIKGLMMSGGFALQLTAKAYSDAVREVLQRTGSGYEKLTNNQTITLNIQDTPDKVQGGGQQGAASAETIEMVSESDYEFCVKAAKKFNFEFFTDRGTVYFRKSKSNQTPLIKLKAGEGISRFEVSYSISGMVETVEARTMDAGSGKLITATGKYTASMSTKNTAKGLVSKSKKVYIDPSITSQKDADARVDSLLESMSYRLGSLECDCPGIPELVPGRFVTIDGLGSPVDNNFYITTVIHDFTSDTGYRTKLLGKASAVKK